MGDKRPTRSRAMGGAEDEILPIPEAHNPGESSRAKDELFADPPREESPNAVKFQSAPPIEGSDTTPPERHSSGGPYDDDSSDRTFYQADYQTEETNKKGGDS